MRETLGRLIGTSQRYVLIWETDAGEIGVHITVRPETAKAQLDYEGIETMQIPEYVEDETHYALSQLARVNS